MYSIKQKIATCFLKPLALLLISVGYANAQAPIKTSFELFNGTKVQDSQWSALGFNKTDGNETRFEIDNSEKKSGSTSMKVTYPKGQGGLNNSGGQDVLLLPNNGRDEYYLSYWVKFDPGFDWGDPSKNVGGKLPGLSGGGNGDANAGCSGGENCNGNNGFSIRYMWRKDGNAILYVYDMDKPGRYPTDIPLRKSNGKQIKFEKDQWIHLVMRVKINTVSGGNANKDGEIEVWVDNEKVFGPEDKKFRFVKNGDKVEKFLFSTFHGGSSSSWAPRRNNTAWFDDVTIATKFSDIFSTADDDNDGVPNVVDGCPTDPNKSAPGICGCFVPESSCSFEEQFNDQDITNSVRGETTLTKIEAEETACGELRIKDKTLGNFDPLFVDILNPTDISENPVVEIRVRSTEPVKIRIDVRDINDNKTSGPAGKIERQVKGDPKLWQVLRFEYPLAAFAESGVDITKVKTFDIMFDAGSPGFDGEVYIDYIAIAKGLGNANSTCISGAGTEDCLGQPGGDAYFDDCNVCVGGESEFVDCSASNLFEEQFDDQSVNITGFAYSRDNLIALEETGCGELKIEDINTESFSIVFLDFPTPLDVSSNSKVVISARATDNVKLRIDLRADGKRNSANAGGDIRLDIEGNPNVWKQYTFDFPASSFTGMDATAIEQIGITVNPGIAGFNGTIWIDYISVGDPTGTGGADESCPEIGKDCNGVTNGTAVFDVRCDECVGGNTGLASNFCVTGGLGNVADDNLNLFPNPTSNKVEFTEEVEWSVLSTVQQTMASGHGKTIDMANFPKGIYLVKTPNKTFKVIKE